MSVIPTTMQKIIAFHLCFTLKFIHFPMFSMYDLVDFRIEGGGGATLIAVSSKLQLKRLLGICRIEKKFSNMFEK